MDLKIMSYNAKADVVLEKLVKKKQRGVIITSFFDNGKLVAVFKFSKVLSGVMRGMSKYVLPQQKEFIDDYLSKQGLTKKDYEVIIK